MASDNQVTIVGNLTDDPELRYTPNGAAVWKFRVAVNRRIHDGAGGWKDGETSYFTVSCWRASAENAAESLTRGTRVVVAGRLNTAPGRARRATSGPPSRSRPTRSARASSGRPRRSSSRPARAAARRRRLGRARRGARGWGGTGTRRHHWMPGSRAEGRKRASEKDDKAWQKKRKRKVCIFCKDRIDYVDYKDVVTLRKFVSERGKIRARRVTGNCVAAPARRRRSREERARDGAPAVQRADEDHPPEARREARRPRRRGRGRRRLRAQLPDPPGDRRQGHKGAVKQAESLRRAHDATPYAEGRVRGDGVALIAGGPLRVDGPCGRGGEALRLGHRRANRRRRSPPDRRHGRSRDVHLDEPIRSIGAHEVRVHLFHEVEPVVTVEVVPEG